MRREAIYSVNKVLSLCNVSRRELFNYEDKGLVSPERNIENNYRFYTEQDIFKICFIKECRNLNFDFESIKMILEDNSMPVLRQVIRHAADTARRELNESYNRYIHRMEKYNSIREATYIIDSNLKNQEVEIVEIPDRYIVYHDYEGSFFDPILKYQIQYAELDRIIEKYNFTKISPCNTCFSKHFDPVTGEVSHEVHTIRSFYQVSETMSDCPSFILMPGSKALMLKHVGNYYEGLAYCYERIAVYAQKNGYILKGFSIEELILDESFSYINRNNWATKIYMPIRF